MSTEAEHPFIEFLCQFKELSHPPSKLSDLVDGLTILEVTQLLPNFRVTGDICYTPQTFGQRLHNLKVLYRSLQDFWNSRLGLEIEGEEIDLVEMVHSQRSEEICKLIGLVVKTVVQVPGQQYFIEMIVATSKFTQEYLFEIVKQGKNEMQRESPRKEKYKRMIDKMLEYEHENQKLTQILEILCGQKMDLENKIQEMSEQLVQKDTEMQNLRLILGDDGWTPRKMRIAGIPDTSERKEGIIEHLKQQMEEMSASHQMEIQRVMHSHEKAVVKADKFDQFRDEFELLKKINESYQEQLEEARIFERQFSSEKARRMDCENEATILREKFAKANQKILQLQSSQTYFRAELQKKTIELADLQAERPDDWSRKTSPQRAHNNQNTLFMDFPDMANTETEAYIQTNRLLREQLERTRKTLQSTHRQAEDCQKQNQVLKGCENENRKLRSMVIELKSHRGQENQVLYATVLELTRRLKGQRVGQ